MASWKQAVAWLKAHPTTPEPLTAGLRASLERAQLLTLKAAVKKTRSSSRHCLSFPWELLLAVLLPFASVWVVLQLCYCHACTWLCTPLIRVPAPVPQADCPQHPRSCHHAFTWWPLAPALPALLWFACWAWWIHTQPGLAQPLQPGGPTVPCP